MNVLGFIGGSGIYKLEFLTDIKEHQIKSSFGDPSGPIIEGKIDNNTVYFLSRHGEGHTLSPSSINYCANIDCLKQVGVTDLISLSAVGSLKDNLKPGTFVIVDQFIDRTINRKKSFFDKGIVAHVPMAHPTCEVLMNLSKFSVVDFTGTISKLTSPLSIAFLTLSFTFLGNLSRRNINSVFSFIFSGVLFFKCSIISFDT